MSRDRLLKLAAIATAAGAFSGLLGVGGGTVIVPLLIFWLGYGEREATGTSLAAIVIIAALAAGGQGLSGSGAWSEWAAASSSYPPWRSFSTSLKSTPRRPRCSRSSSWL